MDPEFLQEMVDFCGALDFGTDAAGRTYVGIQLSAYHRVHQKPDESLEELLTRACDGALVAHNLEIENV